MDTFVERLQELAAERDAIDAQITRVIVTARLLDQATWADIGAGLGISKQGAQQRYSNRVSLAESVHGAL